MMPDYDGYLKGRTEMQYLLMLHAEEAGWERLTKEQQQQGAAAYMAYGEALKQAGVLRGSNRLRPSSAATTAIRVQTVRREAASRRARRLKPWRGGVTESWSPFWRRVPGTWRLRKMRFPRRSLRRWRIGRCRDARQTRKGGC